MSVKSCSIKRKGCLRESIGRKCGARLSVLLVWLILVSVTKVAAQSERPNIILIYADDLGIGLLGHEGQKIISTPNIDQLARDGIRFQRSYANMLCAPARASLITGLHDAHADPFPISNAGAYVRAEESTLSAIEKSVNEKLPEVSKDQVFMGQVAQGMGYKTAQFGKLEWGFSTTHQQLVRHGWDYYLGYLDHGRAHGFYPPFLFENGKMAHYDGNTLLNAGKSIEPETEASYKERWDKNGKETYSQDIFMQGLLGFIESNKENPFFIYFPTQLPHGPVSIPEIHPDFANDDRLTSIEKEYASMVKMLDDNVGQIVEKLRELNLEENTLVIFTSDNGHEIYYSKEGRIEKPYTNIQTGERFDDHTNKYYSELAGDVFDGNGGQAGMKRSNLEGGIRVPLIIKWPEKIGKGAVSQRLTANYDLLPTIAEITGYSKTFESDGLSFYNELVGEGIEDLQHDFVVYSSFTGPTLITQDGWKLRTILSKNVFELFFLPEDLKEENDLSALHPDKLAALKTALLEACDGDYQNGLYSTRKSQIKLN
ncbi:arylsulfatase [Algoriphagus aquimarinus]|uniref:arylsulfatase n=1 Tax=Algoriphagus aquimarinus TaxID=237018 RepID=UPI0030DDA0FB